MISITTGDVTSSAGIGISATSGGPALIIDTTAGAISAGVFGIAVRNTAGGARGTFSITTGDVLAQYSGVNVSAGVGVTIDTSRGTINSGGTGIAGTNGGGSVSITTADVTTTRNSAIAFTNGTGGVDVTIDTTAGTVVGGTTGIEIAQFGSGILSITTGNVTGSNGNGIFVRTESRTSDLTIDTSLGAVTGELNGIEVLNTGIGALMITTSDVTGNTRAGIDVRQGVGATNLMIDTTAGSVSGNIAGIVVENLGSGSLSITTGDVTGNGRGIDARQGIGGTDIIIDSSAGTVNAGSGAGVIARNDGTGAVSITTGDVTSNLNNGITLTNFGADITIDTSAGAVSGEGYGIQTFNYGTGAASIVTGDVTGTRYRGIFLLHSGLGVTIDSSAGAVNGGIDGIDVRHNGSGALSITTGSVTGFAGQGIRAQNLSTGTDFNVDSSAGAVSGANDGIFLRNNGSGALSITTADVTGTTGRGIDASNSANGTAFTVDTSAGAVTAANQVIIVSNFGSGPLSITTGDVTATASTGSGIIARNSGNGLGLSIDTSAGAVTAADLGVYANNSAGVLSVITGDVTGLSAAISATNNGTDFIIDTSAGALSTRAYGIDARQFGTGALTITTADVTGTADFGRGIDAYSSVNGTDITIDSSAGSVRGGYDGIRARNNGSGALSITTGEVTGTRERGINATNSAAGTDLTIDSSAGSVTGATYGIFAYNSGTGALSITTGDVSGTTRQGLSAFQSANGTAFTIDTTAGTVTGASFGIVAGQYGNGALSITTGDVTGMSSTGIEALSSGSGLSIDSSAGSVIGGTNGIYARNLGSGALSITAADVSGTSSDGIDARNDSTGTNLAIDSSAGTVTGANYGIVANNDGTGALTITTGDVTGTTRQGLSAFQSANGTAFTIDTTAGTVTGASFGIVAGQYGNGALSITTGDVTGMSSTGIEALSSGTDLSIDTSAGTVTGGTDGIFARNNGTGALSITTGDVTGNTGRGINASNSALGTDLIIDTTAGAVTGETYGIFADNFGSGETFITVNDVTGGSASGIFARSAGVGADVTVQGSSGNILGGTTGIQAITGGGDIRINNLDSVSAQAGNGLGLLSAGGSISVSDIGLVLGTDGNGIMAASSGGAISILGVGLTGGVVGTGGSGIIADARGGMGGDITIGTTSAIGDVSGEGGMTGIGILALTDGLGLVTINTRNSTVAGENGGIQALALGSGSVAIDAATVTATIGNGIMAGANGGDIAIDTRAGAVTAGRTAIVAEQNGAGSIAVTVGDVNGQSADGIVAQGSGGDISINSLAGTVSAARSGIIVIQDGAGAVGISTADVSAAMESAIAVQTGSDAAMVTIDTTAGAVAGGRDGIMVINEGVGTTTITTANVSGAARFGVIATNAGSATDLLIDTTAGTVTAGDIGIAARNDGTGALTITSADVTNTSGSGIYANVGATGTDLAIDSSAGAIIAADTGIMADHRGSGTLAITTGDVTDTNGSGVVARSAASGTGLTVDTSAGNVTGAVSAITVQSYGMGPALITTGDVISTGGRGIDAISAGSLLEIDTTGGMVIGSAIGIRAETTAGTLTLMTADVNGLTGAAIDVVNGGSDARIDTAGGTVIGQTDGISAVNEGTGAVSITAVDVMGLNGSAIRATGAAGSNGITITASGLVVGSLTGIDVSNDSDSPTIIINDGTITANTGEAIRASGPASSVITNNGELQGFVSLGEGSDSLTNNGMFLARGNSAFGAGTDIFTNNDTFRVSGMGPVILMGLESFANTGIVQLANGATGNNLAVSGNFIGSGNSLLAVDVDFAIGISDLLTVDGAATGSTIVNLASVGGATGGIFTDILVVDAGSGTSATAFTLSGGTQTFGLIDFELTFDLANNDFLLSSAPSLAAMQFGNLAETSRNIWTQSANAFSDQMATIRDTGGSGVSSIGGANSSTRIWLTGYGSTFERQRAVTTTINNITATNDLGYDQDFFGFLAGMDFGSEALRYGVTGGFLNSQVEFDGLSNGVDYDVVSFGGYIAADVGPFWANALAKYDRIDGSLQSTTGGLTADVNGSVIGGQAEAGALIGDRSAFFLEPNVSLAFASTNLEDIATTQGTFAFNAGDSILGRVGTRIGTGLALGKTSGVLFASAHYVHEFEGEDGVAFGAGNGNVFFGNLPIANYTEIGAGIMIGNDDDAITGSFQGNVIAGGEIDGFGGSVNLRYRF